MLRDTQEVLADKEFRTGDFYHHKGSFPAAANRMTYVSQQYPLYSGADEALFELADAYKHMGDRFENQEADALTKIVRDYPLSPRVAGAKERLVALKRPVPQADPAAYARQKYEAENASRPGMLHRSIEVFASRPDTSLAAKAGAPAMQSLRPAVPVSVPAEAAGGQSGISDVTVGAVGDTSAIDQKQDARLGTPVAAPASPAATPAPVAAPAAAPVASQPATPAPVGNNGQPRIPGAETTTATAQQPLPTNHPLTADQLKAYKKEQIRLFKQAKKNAEAAQKAAGKSGTKPATPATATPATPAGATPAAAPTGTPATPSNAGSPQ
jgi:outer membrane protein assembly factor BamD